MSQHGCAINPALVGGCLVVAALWCGPVEAEQFIADPAFAAGTDQPTLASWRIDSAVGGNFRIEKEGGNGSVVVLTGERVVAADGRQVHAGRLIHALRTPVVPGRTYAVRIEARGEGTLRLGAVEFADKHSPLRVGTPLSELELTPQWQTLSMTFTPSDAAMYASPCFEIQGWHGHAALRQPSFEDRVTAGSVSVTVEDFVFAAGEPVAVRVAADHAPIKLLIYGPGGVPPGPGGPYGGADAWIDHFECVRSATVRPGAPAATLTVSIPQGNREGFRRIVAVDPATGQKAEARFSIYPAAIAAEFRDLATRIDLPAGARLVFLGDSLTDFYRGRNYVDLVSRACASKFGDRVSVINAGVGGNNIEQIEARLTRDVLDKKPTHVFLFEGANDCKRAYDPATGLRDAWACPVEDYGPAYGRVIEKIKAADSQVIVMTMAPGDQRILEPFRRRAKDHGKSTNFFCLPEDTAKVVAIQKRLAAEHRLPVIDIHAHLQSILDHPDDSQYLHVDDGVHISEHGSREVALMVLRYLAGPDLPGKSASGSRR